MGKNSAIDGFFTTFDTFAQKVEDFIEGKPAAPKEPQPNDTVHLPRWALTLLADAAGVTLGAATVQAIVENNVRD